ncbi:MAG TPA: polysaccharide biosynthesis/export family protein [Pyrinomonadaceae bacterium]|jgi:protein involved in polysaccharide export with SLBB domain|nr:polysaccharide biosynthesis/export family protein [Pyrinomonadaceae bacterium]
MTKRRQVVLVVLGLLALTTSVAAQPPQDPQKERPRTATTSSQQKDKKDQKQPVVKDRLEPDDTTQTPNDVSQDIQANRQEQLSEEAAIVPYYNNFFSTYRLGPEDIISVEVFNQDRYSRKGIIVPPSGRVSLSLIPGGVFVNGKTVEEVAQIITKKYDEYIIDPQVTVSLDKASSYRYSVIGDVGQPGVRLMSHRMTVTEALAEAGGVLSTGDRSKVYVLRRQPTGVMAPILVNVSAIYKGKAADNVYLVPGDQIVVPGNKMKKVKEWLGFGSVLSFARVFGVPVP